MNESLYNLIKKTSQKKGRPLKIVVDWDEVIQPLKPLLEWQHSDRKIPFDKIYFENYWKKFKGKKYFDQRMALKGFEDFYEEASFLSAAGDLLELLKEGIVKEMIFMSAYHVGKQGRDPNLRSNPIKVVKFKKCFGKFPGCSWAPTCFSNKKIEGVAARNSADCKLFFLRDHYPDFDIFVDDSGVILKKVWEAFPSRLYLIPDLFYQKKKDQELSNIKNIKFYSTACIKLADRDFALGALEYRTNKLQQGIQELKANRKETKPNSSTPTWLIAFPIISIILAWLVWIVIWKRKPRK